MVGEAEETAKLLEGGVVVQKRGGKGREEKSDRRENGKADENRLSHWHNFHHLVTNLKLNAFKSLWHVSIHIKVRV